MDARAGGSPRPSRSRGYLGLDAAREDTTARQLAISTNQLFCAQVSGTAIQYRTNTSTNCTGGAAWTGPGTDGAGVVRLSNNMSVSGGPSVTFTSLGTAIQPGTFTVTNPNGGTRAVIVAASGRVRVQ